MMLLNVLVLLAYCGLVSGYLLSNNVPRSISSLPCQPSVTSFTPLTAQQGAKNRLNNFVVGTAALLTAQLVSTGPKVNAAEVNPTSSSPIVVLGELVGMFYIFVVESNIKVYFSLNTSIYIPHLIVLILYNHITGSSGKTGKLIVEELSAKGIPVVATYRNVPTDSSSSLKSAYADVTKVDTLEPAIKGASVVIFAASASSKGGSAGQVDYQGTSLYYTILFNV